MKINGLEQNYFLLGKVSQFLNNIYLLNYLDEILDRDILINKFEKIVFDEPEFETKKFKNIFDFRFYRILLYVIVRAIKPKIIIETGVMHGLSSSFILKAIEKNEEGRLFSIDAPSYKETGPVNQDNFTETLPHGKEPGWIIPSTMKKNWELKIGKSRDVLPSLIDSKGQLDFFIHDSEHTYENMMFELKLAWEKLRSGGIIICDNIDANKSFEDFCTNINKKPLLLSAPDNSFNEQIRFGLLVK